MNQKGSVPIKVQKMKLVTIHAPKGKGQQIAEFAFAANISEVAISEASVLRQGGKSSPTDLVFIQSNTPKVKTFLESLMRSSFYDPDEISFTVKHPESIYASELPEHETEPLIRSTMDVYEELWQFCKITVSLVGRIFLSAVLIAYGMREDFIPLIISGLLFLPYHHHMLGIALGLGIKEWRFFRQALLSFCIATFLIFCGGTAIALLTGPGIQWTTFSETGYFFSFVISLAIGIAASLAAIDDAGRRELIGLAATAHISVYPVWFGLKLIYGFEPTDEPLKFFLLFLMDVLTVIFFAMLTFKLMQMKGEEIKKFIRSKRRKTG